MECLIEQSQTVVSVEKELKRYQKKMAGFSTEDKMNGFINCVKGTYDFIYGVSGENEIEFSKDKLFTGFLLTDGRLKAASTNYNSLYRIRGGKVANFFEKIEKPAYAVDKPKDEDYSPSKGVIKEYETDDLKPGDIFLFATTNANTRIDEEIIEGFFEEGDDAEEVAWKVVNEAGNHSIDDNLIVISISLEALSEHKFLETVEPIEPVRNEDDVPAMEESEEPEKKVGLFAAAASIFKPGRKDGEKAIDKEEVLVETTKEEEKIVEEAEPDEEPVVESQPEEKKKRDMSFPGVSGEYKKLNVKRPRFMKRRMNI